MTVHLHFSQVLPAFQLEFFCNFLVLTHPLFKLLITVVNNWDFVALRDWIVKSKGDNSDESFDVDGEQELYERYVHSKMSDVSARSQTIRNPEETAEERHRRYLFSNLVSLLHLKKKLIFWNTTTRWVFVVWGYLASSVSGRPSFQQGVRVTSYTNVKQTMKRQTVMIDEFRSCCEFCQDDHGTSGHIDWEYRDGRTGSSQSDRKCSVTGLLWALVSGCAIFLRWRKDLRQDDVLDNDVMGDRSQGDEVSEVESPYVFSSDSLVLYLLQGLFHPKFSVLPRCQQPSKHQSHSELMQLIHVINFIVPLP